MQLCVKLRILMEWFMLTPVYGCLLTDSVFFDFYLYARSYHTSCMFPDESLRGSLYFEASLRCFISIYLHPNIYISPVYPILIPSHMP